MFSQKGILGYNVQQSGPWGRDISGRPQKGYKLGSD